jgi:hypothetical protein
MEQHTFMKYKNMFPEGSSEKVNKTIFKNGIIKISYCLKLSAALKNFLGH